jgi:hypothetical protein
MSELSAFEVTRISFTVRDADVRGARFFSKGLADARMKVRGVCRSLYAGEGDPDGGEHG